MNRIGFIASSVLLALALASSTLFVVDQRQFGVVYALGQIKEVIGGNHTSVGGDKQLVRQRRCVPRK